MLEKLSPTAVSPRIITLATIVALLGVTLLVGAARARRRSCRTSIGQSKANTAPYPILGSSASSEPPAPSLTTSPGPFERLPEVAIYNRNGEKTLRCRLYSSGGEIDEFAAQQLDVALADTRDPKQPKVTRIDRRLLQLLFRTAYHFEASRIDVTSAYREQKRRREGLHALGRAVDFAIPGVKTEELASYLRKQPRVGVGVYTHRRTRFVHLDVRDQSYHWLDASPPRRTWRGVSIGDKSLLARDAAYEQKTDWPEGLPVPIGGL